VKDEIYAQVSPDRIDILTKLVEAYDHLGVVSTLDQNQGTVLIRVTTDTCSEMLEILQHMPFPITIAE